MTADGDEFPVMRQVAGAEQELKRVAAPRPSAVYFCARCAANEGEKHLQWCHLQGVVTTGSPAEEGVPND